MNLTMDHFLDAVARHGLLAREALLDEGYHHKVILRKAIRAAGKGYVDYGTVADRCWLEPAGRNYLSITKTTNEGKVTR